jgi:hypothetical protein
MMKEASNSEPTINFFSQVGPFFSLSCSNDGRELTSTVLIVKPYIGVSYHANYCTLDSFEGNRLVQLNCRTSALCGPISVIQTTGPFLVVLVHLWLDEPHKFGSKAAQFEGPRRRRAVRSQSDAIIPSLHALELPERDIWLFLTFQGIYCEVSNTDAGFGSV